MSALSIITSINILGKLSVIPKEYKNEINKICDLADSDEECLTTSDYFRRESFTDITGDREQIALAMMLLLTSLAEDLGSNKDDDKPSRRTPNIRRNKPDRRYHARRRRK